MTDIVDGQPLPRDPNLRAAGWLGDRQPTVGRVCDSDTQRTFEDRLFAACQTNVVERTSGHHMCPMCPGNPSSRLRFFRGDDLVWLGDGELHFTEADGTVWAAPTLILHYVDRHDYRPPDGFVRAVLREDA